MKFICSKDDFQRTLSVVENAIPVHTSLPILTNVYIKAKDNKVTITGTDLEISIISSCDAEVEEEGEITILAKRLMDILKTFPLCNIQISVDKKEWNSIKINPTNENINVDFNIRGLDAKDYPEVKRIDGLKTFIMEQPVIKDMIKKTIFAISKEDSRRFLQGIFFEKKEDKEIHLVATDGRRLSFIKKDIDELSEYDNFSITIPCKPLYELVKRLRNEGDCEIAISDKKVFFKFNDIEISSSVIDTEFLNYKAVIPESTKEKLFVDLYKLLNALYRVASILDGDEKKIKFEIRKDYLTMYGHNDNFGEAKEKIEIDYDGEGIDVGLNYMYVIEVLRNLTSEDKVTIEFTSNTSPFVLKEEGNDKYLSIIGPMRLED